MVDFPSWCVENGFLSKGTIDEAQKSGIDWYERLSPQQKDALSTGVFAHKAEKFNLPQFDSVHKFRQSDFIVEVPERQYALPDSDSQAKLIQEYFDAIKEVAENNKLSTEQKLKKLLTPLINLGDITFPPGYKSNLKFIGEDINLKEELDIENLINNPEKYSIVEDTELRELGILRADNRNIRLSERYEYYLSYCKQVAPISEAEFDKKYPEIGKLTTTNKVLDIPEELLPFIEPEPLRSVSDIYELWLPTLTPEKMKSNDLLDRILVTYTIKRALNRDEKAIDKLCGLFQNVAEGIAVKMAVKRRLKKHIGDIRADAMFFLRLIVGGFSPKMILDSLNQTANFKIPKSVENFYIYWLSEEVPERLNKFPLIDPFDVVVLLNPISPINAETRWRTTPKAIRMFNSFSFRPNKKTNLYTWLFGVTKDTKGKSITSGHMQGRFCQLLSEQLDKHYKLGKEIVVDNLDEREDYETDNKSLPRSTKHKTTQEIYPEELEAVLLKRGIQKRNIEILILKQKKHSYAEISKLCNISRRQVIRIYQKYKPLLKKLVAEDNEE